MSVIEMRSEVEVLSKLIRDSLVGQFSVDEVMLFC